MVIPHLFFPPGNNSSPTILQGHVIKCTQFQNTKILSFFLKVAVLVIFFTAETKHPKLKGERFIQLTLQRFQSIVGCSGEEWQLAAGRAEEIQGGQAPRSGKGLNWFAMLKLSTGSLTFSALLTGQQQGSLSLPILMTSQTSQTSF